MCYAVPLLFGLSPFVIICILIVMLSLIKLSLKSICYIQMLSITIDFFCKAKGKHGIQMNVLLSIKLLKTKCICVI